jgi:hypothetical protein
MKKLIILSCPIVILVCCFCMGYYFAVMDIRNVHHEYSVGSSMGLLLTETEKLKIVQSYSNPEEAKTELDTYSWDVPTVVTPFVGSAPKPGIHQNAVINSFQMRNENDPKSPKPKNRFRIILIGGSTAYSSGAPSQNKTIGSLLEKLLIDKTHSDSSLEYEVFTLASPSWSTTHERIIVENRLLDLEPDLVISLSGNNDCHWGALGGNTLWFRNYADDYNFELRKILFQKSFLPTEKDIVIPEKNKVDPEIVSDRLTYNVKLSSYALSLMNCNYFFILQPTLAVSKKQLNDFESSRINEDWKEYFNKCYKLINEKLSVISIQNYKYFNATKVFDDLGANNQIFLDMYHFGDKGNEIISNYIYCQIDDWVDKDKNWK